MTCKFVFKLKDPDIANSWYKACLIAPNYLKTSDLDYSKTFAFVAKLTFVCSIFALSAIQALYMYNFDVKTAYLYSTIKHKFYMEQLLYFEVSEFFRDEWIYLINKSLYRRYDSSYLWYNTVNNKLTSLNFIKFEADECVFIFETPDHYIIIAYWWLFSYCKIYRGYFLDSFSTQQ